MGERSGYPAGTPNWVDLGTDVDGALPFYTELFGWTAESAGPVELTGGYGQFSKDGKRVAGYGPQMNPGPPAWATYFASDDIEATAATVTANEGQVVMPPMAVMDQGHMGVFQDPTGALFSVWQPGLHTGSELVNAPGAPSWNELLTRDPDRAAAFYAAVFGLETKASTESGDTPYYEWYLDGRIVGGMLPMDPAHVPAEVPPHWGVYFGVDDIDAGVAKVLELGGGVVMRMDTPAGPMAGVHDPQGAMFSIIQLTDPDD